ncbi:uncharacterized protein RCC_03252 [Ramularia collo-cygni]|uniref:Uncharacterized protein n=1 Tax=Ramularia collo-cygni TaxID=112498 RepID=A0A2D3URY7_9PEZI|nr:uncharacterized protein RCC_03252 [Ramularia collo-cygni]CZT17418.1 uncharacterized protein RCC_03252 [Ramularia collo-cygni]
MSNIQDQKKEKKERKEKKEKKHSRKKRTPLSTTPSPNRVTKLRGKPTNSPSPLEKKILKGSTFPYGIDPLHALIPPSKEPTHWIQTRDLYATYPELLPSKSTSNSTSPSPPDVEFYNNLPNSPPGEVSSGVDVNLSSMEGREFWGLMEGAWGKFLRGETGRGRWEVGGEGKGAVGSLLWDERELEEAERELEEAEREVVEEVKRELGYGDEELGG